MIRYLIDSSALWRILREDKYRASWQHVIAEGVVGSCAPQRAEFRRSARDLDDYEQMNDLFSVLYPDVPVPKGTWRWIEAAQYRLVRGGAHRSMFAVDLMVAATAAHHGLTVLHDDGDFVTAARFLSDLHERSVRDAPSA
ncbi:PIN domain-containing protein [Nocardiopsis chromatogenes]|uniref:PIN domain-containing protein n=1 Tax=Nocardiopsis chromatogenes TaxID=280239 RepID=UPI00034642F1|nr:PIN domain-containing protein [Nocardiopsis chromatogenes]